MANTGMGGAGTGRRQEGCGRDGRRQGERRPAAAKVAVTRLASLALVAAVTAAVKVISLVVKSWETEEVAGRLAEVAERHLVAGRNVVIRRPYVAGRLHGGRRLYVSTSHAIAVRLAEAVGQLGGTSRQGGTL